MNSPITGIRNASGLAFDSDYLDELMDKGGLDTLLVTSKHNVSYLLGGHRSNFFQAIDAIGVSRFLPVVIYRKGRPDHTTYIGTPTEKHENDVAPLPVPHAEFPSWTTHHSVQAALAALDRMGVRGGTIGVEMSFLPLDAYRMLTDGLGGCDFKDCFLVLERLRACKTPQELELLREASERITESMLATLKRHGEGSSKNEIVQTLREEETARGLHFEYCLISMGPTVNRAPSDQRCARGETLSVDSGGSYRGYIGDLARMGVVGEPDQELIDLLAEVDEIQQAATRLVAPGVIGLELYEAAEQVIGRSQFRDRIAFLAHGVGIITHEVPRLTTTGPVPYEASDAELPLEAGMVLSIETDLVHPTRGFIKLEDTVAVVEGGHEMYGTAGRDWNVAGRS